MSDTTIDPTITVDVMVTAIIENLDGDPITKYKDFDEFFDWLDVLTHYDQMDDGHKLSDHKDVVEQAYNQILADNPAK